MAHQAVTSMRGSGHILAFLTQFESHDPNRDKLTLEHFYLLL
jgi:hypothetical protein